MHGKDKQQYQEFSDIAGVENAYVAPGTKIRYKKSLISKYCNEHRNILSTYHNALSAYQSRDNQELLRHLESLQSALRNHVLDEGLNMYVYLKHFYATDTKKLDLISRFNRNMKKSGMSTFSFIRRFTEDGEAVPHNHDFLSQLLQIGNSLEVQLAAEERHLYHLYRNTELLTDL